MTFLNKNIDKMDIDKMLRFGPDKVCYTYSSNEYDRSIISIISPLTDDEIISIIDKNYINREYMPRFNSKTEYLKWSTRDDYFKVISLLRKNHIKNKIKSINRR